ncbi:MAG: hemolysin family protein [Acidimicrobiales bacterium]
MVGRRRTRSRRGEDPAAALSAAAGAPNEQERYILAALLELRDTTVNEVMTPRVDVVGLPIPVHASDVARAVRESGHSCFPVFDDDIDNLVGVLYVNDLFRAGWAIDEIASAQGDAVQGDATNGDTPNGDTTDEHPSPIEISRRLRQPFLVPESRRVLEVLSEMRAVRRTFAVVVDEYGGVAGVITVKDLLAAIVGDLHDEFDPAGEPEIVRVDHRRWLVDGGTSIDDVRTQLGLNLPEGKYVTIGGYIFDVLGHIPHEGERLRSDEWELRVVEMEKRRVAKVLVIQPTPSPSTAGAH